MIEVPDSIITELNRIALKNEREHEFIIDVNSIAPGQIFEAVVLSDSPEKTNNKNIGTAYGNTPINNSLEPSYYFVRVRRKEIDDLTTPDPFLEKNPSFARQLVNMHPIGVLQKAAGDVPMGGDLWDCTYLTKDRKGIILLNRTGVDKGFLALGDKDSIFQAAANAWEDERYQPNLLGTATSVPPVTVMVSRGTRIPGALNFTWENLKELAALGIFDPLLHEIRQHECSLDGCATKHFGRNQYDAFNYYGSNGKAGYIGNNSYMTLGWGMLSQWSIAQVVAGQSTGAKVISAGSGRLFASGAYQIIPNTMKSAIERINGLNTGEIYNKTNQDALGIYLVTMKRSILGKYLFGDSVSAAAAGNQLAYEFASIRLQQAATRSDGARIPAYSRYYGGVGLNQFGGIDKADADRTMNAINSVRQAIDNNSRALAIRNMAME